jgi:hypothetical protein
MDLSHRSGRLASPSLRYLALIASFTLAGCASPGPPHAPSLNLPQPVRDLTANRVGNAVELHFTVPSRSPDKLPLRGGTLTGQLCRQLPHQPCVALPASKTSVAVEANPNKNNSIATWTDTLPSSLTGSPAQLLAYRIEFFNSANHSAGPSTPAFTASGPAPAPVENLQVQGSRLGTLLTWNPSPTVGDVILQRELLAPAKPHQQKTLAKQNTAPHPAQPTIVWLQTHAPNAPPTSRILDTTALPDTPYRYTAQRRLTLQLGHRTLDLHSPLSEPISFTLLQIFPPQAPTGLTALGFFNGTPATFAVDLIWQPSNDTGLITPLAGYNLYREPLNSAGQPTSQPTQLNTTPIPTPAFHDTAANPTTTYRYTVTAVDTHGNQSPAATVLLHPTAP